MTDLPPGWTSTTLGEIAETMLGKMLDRRKDTGEHPQPYLRNVNVQWGRIDLNDILTMDIPASQQEVFELEPGDLLVCEGGEIGRCAIWNYEDRYMAFQKALHRVRPYGGIDPRYIRYLFEHLAQEGKLLTFATGSTIKHLSQEQIRRVPVPLPPLTEQRRIVAALEDLLSHLDSGRYGLKGVERRLKILARRIIVEAVPTPGPDHWKIVTVADAGKVELGRQRHPDWHTGPHMRPYLRVANVFEDRIDSSDLMEMNFPPDIFERFRLEEGDILLNEGQSPEYLGRPAMYRGSPPDVAFTNSLIRFQVGPDVLPEWALLVFRRHMHARRFIKEVRITTNIAHLSASRLKGVEFPIPPLEEQKEIVAAVHEQLDHVARMSAAVASGTTRSDHLRQALLSETFAGRLVPQDPEDEPASVLLERIKAERAAVQAPKCRARRTGPKTVAPKSESRTRPETDTRPIVDIPAPSSTASKGTPVQETLL